MSGQSTTVAYFSWSLGSKSRTLVVQILCFTYLVTSHFCSIYVLVLEYTANCFRQKSMHKALLFTEVLISWVKKLCSVVQKVSWLCASWHTIFTWKNQQCLYLAKWQTFSRKWNPLSPMIKWKTSSKIRIFENYWNSLAFRLWDWWWYEQMWFVYETVTHQRCIMQ